MLVKQTALSAPSSEALAGRLARFVCGVARGRIEIQTAGGDRLVSEWRGDAASYSWSWPEIVSWARDVAGELSETHLGAIESIIEAMTRSRRPQT
jgi:hypothetical protein